MTDTPAVALGQSPHYLYEADPDAGVTVVEFVDFQCPPCGLLAPVMSDLAKEYQGRANFAVRHLPLSMHANAVPAALAVEASASQGAFVGMYKTLFEEQGQWSSLSPTDATAFFRTVADSMGLDLSLWDAAVTSADALTAIQEDLEAATALGVKSTPSVLVNGTLIELDSVDGLRATIDAALDASTD